MTVGVDAVGEPRQKKGGEDLVGRLEGVWCC